MNTMTSLSVAPALAAMLAQITSKKITEQRDPITSLQQLTFNRRVTDIDEPSNCWEVSHAKEHFSFANEIELLFVGKSHFQEIVELFLHDPDTALIGLRNALTSQNWQGDGLVETGFAEEVAELVIIGLQSIAQRALKSQSGDGT